LFYPSKHRLRLSIELTIKPDGSIEPQTNLLKQNGTVYAFKADIYSSIMVQKSVITIDGATKKCGKTLRGVGAIGAKSAQKHVKTLSYSIVLLG
jgi:hypothetical protein